jgi:hypothetical protein
MSDSPRRSLFFLLSVQIRDDHAPQHVRANLQTALDRRHDRLLLDLQLRHATAHAIRNLG